jgi:hypothetical protein
MAIHPTRKVERWREGMKAITIRQPYIGWILDGSKTIEVRSWSTPYRGKLLLHAAKRVDPGYSGAQSETGAILGIVELKDVRPLEPGDAQAARADYQPSMFGWLLVNPVRFPSPIPYQGKLGLFNVAPETLDSIEKLDFRALETSREK